MPDLLDRLRSALAHRYLLERELGRGGMATVYLAQDLRHKRPIALKVLHPALAQTVGPERFQREIELAARLQHPHILTVHDSGETVGQLWFTMPYVEGESLRDRLRREKQLPLEDSVRIAVETARALDYAHRHGVVHRDIKPENILLTKDGDTLVADFGIARALAADAEGTDDRLTETGMAIGTPAYMSPEQAAGDQAIDARTDVYALGTVLYEMLAGEPPFTGPTAQAITAKRLRGEVPRVRQARSTVPETVDRAIHKALALVPADRFSSAAEFARALVGGQVSEPTAAITAAPERGSGPKVSWAMVFGLGLLVIAIIGLLLWQRGDRMRPAGERAAEAIPGSSAHTITGQPSVAVMPFTNLSPDPANEYFSDGMTEELITALGRVQGLRVAARASSFAFKGRPLDVADVSRRLNVTAVLDGSVRRQGSQLRITAELVRANDGTRLWADQYDRELRDVFAVQDELAQAIAGALMPSLRLQPTHAAAPPTTDLTAYELYLRGRYAWGRRSQSSLEEARRLYEQAIALDSGYAQPYAGLADVYLVLPNWTPTRPLEIVTKAESLALHAIRLDSTLAEAHATLGAARAQLHYDWDGAKREFDRAIALNPNYPTSYRYLSAFYYRPRGQHDEELKAAQRAHQLDPLSTAATSLLAAALTYAGRPEEAIARLQGIIRTDPRYGGGEAYRTLAFAQLTKRMYRETIALYQKAMTEALMRPDLLGGLGFAYALTGKRRDALRVLDEMKKEATRTYVAPTQFALVYVGLGDRDRAFEWYQRACQEHNYGLFGFPSGPLTASLRPDPRYDSILRCMRLLRER